MTNFLADSFLPDSRKMLPALSSQAPELWASDHVVCISAPLSHSSANISFTFLHRDLSCLCQAVKCHSECSDHFHASSPARSNNNNPSPESYTPCTNDQSIIALLKLQIIFCLHPCHRQGRAHRVRACSCPRHLTGLRCLGLFEQVKFLASLLSCSWQLSFAGPGLVIVIAASSDHLLISLPPLCPINPPRDQSSEQ